MTLIPDPTRTAAQMNADAATPPPTCPACGCTEFVEQSGTFIFDCGNWLHPVGAFDECCKNINYKLAVKLRAENDVWQEKYNALEDECDALTAQLEQATSEVDASNERARQAEAKTDYYATLANEQAAQAEQATRDRDAANAQVSKIKKLADKWSSSRRIDLTLDQCAKELREVLKSE